MLLHVAVAQATTVRCAGCKTLWRSDYIESLRTKNRLHAQGFAYVSLPGGGIAINCCPRCEPPVVNMEVFPWPILLPSP